VEPFLSCKGKLRLLVGEEEVTKGGIKRDILGHKHASPRPSSSGLKGGKTKQRRGLEMEGT